MVTEYIFEGKLTYPFLQNYNQKYEKYSTNFYPSSPEDRKAIKATGTKCGLKEDDKGDFFYTFTAPKDEKPQVTDAEGQPIPATVLIGNGTEARVKITVEKFTSAKWGDIARTRLVGVVIDKLIEYVKPVASETTGASSEHDPAPTEKKRMPF